MEMKGNEAKEQDDLVIGRAYHFRDAGVDMGSRGTSPLPRPNSRSVPEASMPYSATLLCERHFSARRMLR